MNRRILLVATGVTCAVNVSKTDYAGIKILAQHSRKFEVKFVSRLPKANSEVQKVNGFLGQIGYGVKLSDRQIKRA